MNAPRCLAGQLHVSGVESTGATGMLFTTLRLRNISTSPCQLIGTPMRVSAQSAGQPDVVATRGLHLATGGVGGDLQPARTGYLTVETDRDCAARYSDPNNSYPTKNYTSLSVTLPSATSFVVPKKLDVLCGLRTGGLGVDRPAARQPADPRANLGVEVGVSRDAIAGQAFTYVVTLFNPTASAISLSHCPGYTEWISEADAQEAKASFGLNCSGVEDIAPGQQVRYEMRLDIPADVEPGAADLHWAMQLPGSPGGVAAMTVEAVHPAS
jgi:hypothetical protein